jgi:hypothetical protein
MKPLPRSPIDPFSTMVSLTASALGGTAAAHGPAEEKNARSPSLLARFERWLWKARQRQLERALASAADVTEVEARLRAHERALLHRYY